MIPHFQSSNTPSPDNIRRLLNDYEDKIRIIQNDDRGQIPPKTSKKTNTISEVHPKVVEPTAKPATKSEPAKPNKKVSEVHPKIVELAAKPSTKSEPAKPNKKVILGKK